MTTDNFCFYLQNRQIQTSKTGGQRYSDNSPLVFPGQTNDVPWGDISSTVELMAFELKAFRIGDAAPEKLKIFKW